MANVKYKLVVEIDGNDVHSSEIGYDKLKGLVNELDGIGCNADLIGYLALSPHSDIRCIVASLANISKDTVGRLVSDPVMEVRSRLSGNSCFARWASTEMVLKFIEMDVEIAKRIAGNLELYTRADMGRVVMCLLDHPDPIIRQEMLGSWGGAWKEQKSLAKKVWKKLLADPDPTIRALAKDHFESR